MGGEMPAKPVKKKYCQEVDPMKPINRFLLMTLLLAVWLPALSYAERLQKYQIPSKDYRQAAPSRDLERSMGQERLANTYNDFKRHVKTLTNEGRQKLKAHYQSKWQQALDRQNQGHAQYYKTLLNILNNQM